MQQKSEVGMVQEVELFAVITPGVIPPELITVKPEITKLGWAFAQQSNEDLIDLIPIVDAQMKQLAKWIETAKNILKARVTIPEEPGQVLIVPAKEYEAVIACKARTDIDREGIKKEMGDQWYAGHCKTTVYSEMRFTLMGK